MALFGLGAALASSGVDASCKAGPLSETCSINGLPLIGSVGLEAIAIPATLTAESASARHVEPCDILLDAVPLTAHFPHSQHS